MHLGTYYRVAIAADEVDADLPEAARQSTDSPYSAALVAPPQPVLIHATEVSEQDGHEVLIFDAAGGRSLAAAIEMLGPGNKDRVEHRRSFTAKCLALFWTWNKTTKPPVACRGLRNNLEGGCGSVFVACPLRDLS